MPRRPGPWRSAAVALWLALAGCLSAGCASSRPAATASRGPSASPTPTPGQDADGAGAARCASPAPARLAWPPGVPADLPGPASGRVGAVRTLPATGTGKGGTVVSVEDVPGSVQSQAAFARTALTRAGFTVGRGDAEADEADLPFSRGDVTGQVKIQAAGDCRSAWILTVLRR